MLVKGATRKKHSEMLADEYYVDPTHIDTLSQWTLWDVQDKPILVND